MKLSEIKDILEAKIIIGGSNLGREVKMGCGCDLMSDVLAFTKSNSLLLTGLTNPQVVRTSEIADVAAICFVRGKEPQAETISLAGEKGIPLLATRLPMYESCGKLYKKGLSGCSEWGDED